MPSGTSPSGTITNPFAKENHEVKTFEVKNMRLKTFEK